MHVHGKCVTRVPHECVMQLLGKYQEAWGWSMQKYVSVMSQVLPDKADKVLHKLSTSAGDLQYRTVANLVKLMQMESKPRKRKRPDDTTLDGSPALRSDLLHMLYAA